MGRSISNSFQQQRDRFPLWFLQQTHMAACPRRPGDTIWLAPGVHAVKDLIVSWPLHILGGGRHPEDTLVVTLPAADAALDIRATSKVTNLSMHSTKAPCILHKKGQLLVERCILQCSAASLSHLTAPVVTLASVAPTGGWQPATTRAFSAPPCGQEAAAIKNQDEEECRASRDGQQPCEAGTPSHSAAPAGSGELNSTGPCPSGVKLFKTPKKEAGVEPLGPYEAAHGTDKASVGIPLNASSAVETSQCDVVCTTASARIAASVHTAAACSFSAATGTLSHGDRAVRQAKLWHGVGLGRVEVVETQIVGGSKAVQCRGTGALADVRVVHLSRASLFWFAVDSCSPGQWSPLGLASGDSACKASSGAAAEECVATVEACSSSRASVVADAALGGLHSNSVGAKRARASRIASVLGDRLPRTLMAAVECVEPSGGSSPPHKRSRPVP